jgi:chromosome segregation ATPase
MSGNPSPDSGATSSAAAEMSLAELGRAITRAADSLTAIPGDDEAAAYRCARTLDAALGSLTELLSSVPGIVGLGDPGRAVRDRLERCRSELSDQRREVAAYRRRLDDLAGSERALAEVTAEASRLRDHISELERAERLASEIPGLRTQAKALEGAVEAAGAADAPEVCARIADAIEQLAALTGLQREAIGAEAEKLADAVQLAFAELSEQRTRRDSAAEELEHHESQAAQLAADHQEMLPVLAAWRQADADLAEGLRAAGFGTGDRAFEAVVSELDSIRQRLTDLDGSLRPLLASHAEAYEAARQMRPW